MPSGTAMTIENRKPRRVSGSVTLSRLPISGNTGVWLTKEVPRSKRASLPRNTTNCV